MTEVQKFHSEFFVLHNKQIQNAFILQNVKPIMIKHSRMNWMGETKTVRVKYFISGNTKHVSVCRGKFICILEITKYQVNTVIKNFKAYDIMPKEKRGGAVKLLKKMLL